MKIKNLVQFLQKKEYILHEATSCVTVLKLGDSIHLELRGIRT